MHEKEARRADEIFKIGGRRPMPAVAARASERTGRLRANYPSAVTRTPSMTR